MELTQYFRLIRKWLWLILLGVFIGGGVTYLNASAQPRLYQATVTIAIGSYFDAPNPSLGEITTGMNLVTTYANLTTRYDLLESVTRELNLNLPPEALRGAIGITTVEGTSLLLITVTWPNPVVAADIANTLAEQLIVNSPTNLTPEQEAQIEQAQAQIQALNEQLEELRSQLIVLNEELRGARETGEITRLTVERNTTIDQINQSASTIAQFSSTIASLQQRTNSVEVAEPARIPTRSIADSPSRLAMVGAATGGVLALCLSLVIEYLNATVKSSAVAAEVLHLPVIGVIPRFGKRRDKYPKRLLHRLPGPSIVIESYRKLRTSLMYSLDDKQKKIYVVTSPGPGEGKSITAANLAVSMSQAGLNVLLIDGDLRRPRLHEIFSLGNESGLSTLLFAEMSSHANGVGDQRSDSETLAARLKQAIHMTDVPGLNVITSGPIPSNPTELLGSHILHRWVDLMKRTTKVDVIVFDTPPCLTIADSEVLTATTDADVLLVLDAKRTRRSAALRAKEEFEKIGKQIRGVILNRVNVDEEFGDYGYGHNYYAQKPPVQAKPTANGKRHKEAIGEG